jgi:hypothetical protein
MSGLSRGSRRREGNGGQTPPVSPLLVEYWLSTQRVTLVSGAVDAWTGMKKSTVLAPATSSNRPVYGADSTNFRGKQVVQCAITGSLAVSAAGLSAGVLPSTGERPYTFWVGRMRTAATPTPANQANWAFRTATTTVQSLSYSGTNNRYNARAGTPNDIIRAGNPGAGMYVVETWLDGTNRNSRYNFAAAITAADTGSLAANMASVYVGTDSSSVSDTSHALLMIFTSKPPDSYITSLRNWSRDFFGTT